MIRCFKWLSVADQIEDGRNGRYFVAHYFTNSHSLSDTTHHLKELLEVNLSVSILIDLSDGLIELRLRVDIAELLASQQLQKLA